jgi:hypothetical protein
VQYGCLRCVAPADGSCDSEPVCSCFSGFESGPIGDGVYSEGGEGDERYILSASDFWGTAECLCQFPFLYPNPNGVGEPIEYDSCTNAHAPVAWQRQRDQRYEMIFPGDYDSAALDDPWLEGGPR